VPIWREDEHVVAAPDALYRQVRRATEALCSPLATEDYVVQSMPDVSPAKWHLGHTSWFFETLVLAQRTPSLPPHNPAYRFLFNSYYNALGERHERARRGLASRPTVEEVYAYRRHVDARMLDLLAAGARGDDGFLLELGVHHE